MGLCPSPPIKGLSPLTYDWATKIISYKKDLIFIHNKELGQI